MNDGLGLAVTLHIAIGALTGYLAHTWKGRNGLAWGIIGTFLTLLALLVLCLSTKVQPEST